MDTSLLATDKIFLKPQVRISPSPDILTMAKQNRFNWNIELSNRCNAQCYFCPREVLDKFGNMTLEHIKLAIDRIVEVSPPGTGIAGCGHGEPLLNPHVIEFIRYGTQKGLKVGLVSNGWHLNFVSAKDLLDAGLVHMTFSISEIGETYTQMYKVPFDDVLKNVREFVKLAAGRCEVIVNIVITEKNKPRLKELQNFWRKEGITQFIKMPVINRAGDVSSKNDRYLQSPFRAQAQQIIQQQGFTHLCWMPVFEPFIAWDGSYNLCCNDWSKRHRTGHISDTTWKEVIKNRIDVMNTSTSICNVCDFNIQNRIVDCLEADPDALNTTIPALIEDRKNEEAMMKDFLSSYLG